MTFQQSEACNNRAEQSCGALCSVSQSVGRILIGSCCRLPHSSSEPDFTFAKGKVEILHTSGFVGNRNALKKRNTHTQVEPFTCEVLW